MQWPLVPFQIRLLLKASLLLASMLEGLNSFLPLQTFIKVVNYQHLMPTRYTLEVDLKNLVTPEALENVTKRKETRKVTLLLTCYVPRKWCMQNYLLVIGNCGQCQVDTTATFSIDVHQTQTLICEGIHVCPAAAGRLIWISSC